jgi:CubicO group peptidase (beta-lactamase class C family)
MDNHRSDAWTKRLSRVQLSRRDALRNGGLAVVAGAIGGLVRSRAFAQDATPAATPSGDPAADIIAISQAIFERTKLKAVILQAKVAGEEIVTAALGESMTGVPATTDMHFRNGAVAIAYMGTLVLQMVDQKIFGLDDPIAKWMPELPSADKVTLKMLVNMTSGYQDYVADSGFQNAFYSNPFGHWTAQAKMDIALAKPLWFEPGTNWSYAHTNYVVLGQVLEKIAGKPLADQLKESILDPLGLTNTRSSDNADVPEPVLHAFSSERREFLGVDPKASYYEDTTFWNPSWSLANGSIQTSNISDMVTTAEAIGGGTLLTPESYQMQVAKTLLGFSKPIADNPSSRPLDENYTFGLGVVLAENWILQNPLFAGCGAIEAYLPSKKIAIAVATTFKEDAFDEHGNNSSGRTSWEIFAAIAKYLAPDDAPPATR